MDPDLIDEDASLRRNLAALGPDALRELQTILEAPQPYREAVSRALVARPAASEFATLPPWPTPTRSCACGCSGR